MLMRDFDVSNGRIARLYVDDAAALSLTAAPSELEEFVQSQYWDEDDIERSTVLDSLVRRGPVHADVYPTYRDSNTLKVYLRSDGAPVFACSLLPMARLRQLLKQTPMVLEGFTTQIVPTEHLSVEAIKAAIQQWIERGFPNAAPVITVELYTGGLGTVRQSALHLAAISPVKPPSSDIDAITPTTHGVVDFDPSIVTAPYVGDGLAA